LSTQPPAELGATFPHGIEIGYCSQQISPKAPPKKTSLSARRSRTELTLRVTAQAREQLVMNSAEASVRHHDHDVVRLETWRQVIHDVPDILKLRRRFSASLPSLHELGRVHRRFRRVPLRMK